MAEQNKYLPEVTEEIFMEFLKKYDFTSEKNDPEITNKIKSENPQIYRILEIGMKSAPNIEAKMYYECGIQICYELLSMQMNEYSNPQRKKTEVDILNEKIKTFLSSPEFVEHYNTRKEKSTENCLFPKKEAGIYISMKDDEPITIIDI